LLERLGSVSAVAERNLIKARFVNWLIDYPTRDSRRAAGVPESVVAYAEHADWGKGTARETFARWKTDADVQEQVHKGLRERFFAPDDVALVMQQLMSQAKEGHCPSAKLVLDIAGVTKGPAAPTTAPPARASDVEGLSLAELQKLATQKDEDE
jgi:hypothetical protein